MNRIIFPLSRRMKRPGVGDLQDALQLLLDQGLLLADDEAARRELAAVLKEERATQTFGRATATLVDAFQKQHGLPGSGKVDERTAAALNDAISHESATAPEFQYLVRGQVLYRGGLPIPGLIVRAFHRELRKAIELGTTKTDDNGNFEIYYNTNLIAALSGEITDRPPDLFVRVSEVITKPTPSEKILIESPTRFAAQRVVKFRLLVDGGATNTWSEYEQLAKEFKPYLSDLRIEDLVEDEQYQDVTLLAGKLAQEPGRVAAFIAAHKLAAEVKGNPEVFYALARKGMPTNLTALLAVPPGTRSRALVAAIREGLVPGKLVGEVRKVRKEFDQHAVTFAAADKQTAGRARLGAVLKAAITDQDKVDSLVAKMLTHTGPTAKLWKDLADDPQLKAIVPDAQLTLQEGVSELLISC